ncbi:MAG: ABC transporter permease [Christensenellaceae bacterium]|jgi:osmoprotectant transport system permease protein
MFQDIIALYQERWEFFLQLTLQHLQISGISILLAAAIGLFLGIFISKHKKASPFVIGATNVIYTIPSIALLGFLIPATGIGDGTAIIALTVYALLPMVRGVFTGISNIDESVIETARGMGSTDFQILYRIELPLAAPVILSSLKNMVVMTIALTGIASFIGAGGLGVAIYRGITTNNPVMTVAGSILIAAMALVLDIVIGRVEKSILKRRKMIPAK